MFERLPFVIAAPGNEADVSAIARDAARHWGLPRPTLVRLAVNGVFASGGTVLRVSRTTAPPILALALARRLIGAGLRVAVPARDDVFRAGDGVTVSAWERIVGHSPSVDDWPQVGLMIQRLHGLDALSIDHPLPFCGDFPWWDFDGMIGETALIDSDAGSALRLAVASHSGWYDSARNGPLVVCHGDVHPGNVMVDRHGPILIDWDLLCLGPASWDHAPLMTWTRRWGGDEGVYEAFSAGYGNSLRNDPLAESIAELRLVAATLMRLRAARARADNGEAQRRLAYWRAEPDAPMWRAV